MPKLSGLGLGEIKKVSGVGLGNFKKVSGLGLGMIWQDQIIQTITKNGNFAVSTLFTTVTSWSPQDGSIVLNDGIRVPETKNYIISCAGLVTNSYTFGAVWLQLAFYRNAGLLFNGTQVDIPTNTANNPFSLTDPTPRLLNAGDYINVRADNERNNLTIIGGTQTYLRITSVD